MKNDRLEVRIRKADKALIKRAAKAAKVPVTTFIINAAVVEAEYTLAHKPKQPQQ